MDEQITEHDTYSPQLEIRVVRQKGEWIGGLSTEWIVCEKNEAQSTSVEVFFGLISEWIDSWIGCHLVYLILLLCLMVDPLV